MPKTNLEVPVNISILKDLVSHKVKDKVSFRVAQMYFYLSLKSYVVDPDSYCGEDMVIILEDNVELFNNIIIAMRSEYDKSPRQKVLVIRDIYKRKEVLNWWNIQPYLRLDLHEIGIIIIDDNLNNQKFKLKI